MTSPGFTVDYFPPKATSAAILGEFDTLEAAQSFVNERSKVDAYGVYAGWYGINDHGEDPS